MPLVDSPSLFTEIRDWLEILYFVSGFVMMILFGFGLWQLKLAKDQISLAKDQLQTSKNIFKTQSKRAAIEAAVVECRRYSETVVQDSLALDKYCKEHEITLFDDVVFKKTEDGFSIDPSDVKKEDVVKLAEAEDIVNRYINGLESYALFFLSGIADENIAFHTNAKEFLESAERGFKIFPFTNIDQDDAEPIKVLYFLWHKKLEAKRLKIEQKNIEKKLSGYKDKSIKPIGT
ncbi:hypothetical protein [Vreelandella sp.]|uniref:hypothetical protein n=1 Tax=Vreelandella sp. TaxID=3137778 RepID=UPI003BAB0F9C